jgi:5-methylcytosine-specific restriction endonuclease McrA
MYRKYPDWVPHKKHLLDRCVEAQRGRCAYCVRPMDAPTLDHVIPKSSGGKLIYSNVVAACEPCNRFRDMMDAYQFHALIKKYGVSKAHRKAKSERSRLHKIHRAKLLRRRRAEDRLAELQRDL